MSCCVSTTSLIAGACVVGDRGLGLLGATMRAETSTGAHGAGYLYNDWASGDDAKEFRGLIVTPPSAGTFFAYENGSFDLTGAPDGAYSFVYRLYVDGADLGTATASVTIGTPVAAAPTNSGAPTVTGSAVQGQTLTASTGTWSNSPTSYAYRWLRGASAISGATASNYVLQAGDVGSQIRVGVIATNATGSSAEALSLQSAVVTASGDATPPTLIGALTVGTVTSSSIQITWPAGADNVAVTSYETSTEGSTWTDRGSVLTYTFSGLAASTSYTLRVRAKDAAGNVSTPALSVAQSTSAPAGDTIAPTLSGTITTSTPTSTSYTATCPLAADNVAVTGYQYRLNAGAWTTIAGGGRVASITGRTPSSTDALEMRAFDAAGNYSAALSKSVVLAAVGSATFSAPRGTAVMRAQARHIGGVLTEDIHQG